VENLTEVRGQHALVERTPERQSTKRLPQHSISNILVPLSMAIDLAEGRSPGHAQRIAYISASLAESLGLDREQQLSACYAGLLHDIGVIASGSEIAGAAGRDERLIFASLPLLRPDEALAGSGDFTGQYAERVAEHVDHGAIAARHLELPHEVSRAIATHHERWDGDGYPNRLIGPETPVLGRIIGIADHAEALISQASPLLARRNFAYWMSNISGFDADPEIVAALTSIGSTDSFWLGLFSADMTIELANRCGGLRESRGANLLPMAESFARLVDSRFDFTANVSARVSDYAELIGKSIGMQDVRLKMLRVAALLHDVGQLSMSERILSKPGILSVEEMSSLHQHTIYSRDVVAAIPGMEEVAEWVGAHHERIDGRGYPEGKKGDEIPVEARILAVADAYAAITSDRPHRPRVEGKEARERLVSAAGSQLDSDLVDLFLSKVGD
jgi:putative nucleotidyltransferase with HDIG domain